MTLKDELEFLRGEPIEVFNGNPMDIPCSETSDTERLCKHPIVSVHMITYNHESYIRQAIEGVMMQNTDFEFELVIGEDCSQDKTREICFEYQKKYPDKIRVLWWHENVSKLGGNGRRVTAHCRGEFIAFCEGDDYWIDSFKLQKQVDVMRKYPNVGMVFCGDKIYNEKTGEIRLWDVRGSFPPGLIDGGRFLLTLAFGRNPLGTSKDERFIQTATVMIRKHIFYEGIHRFDILNWRLYMSDCTTWLAVSSLSDCYYLPDVVSVYRVTSTGSCVQNGWRVPRDAGLATVYFVKVKFGLEFSDIPPSAAENLILIMLRCRVIARKYFYTLIRIRQIRCVLTRLTCLPMSFCLALGWYSSFVDKWLSRWYRHLHRWYLPIKVKRLYKRYGLL